MLHDLLQAASSGLFGWTRDAGTIDPGFVVFGVPSDVGNGAGSGARLGPAAIRAASLALPPPAVQALDLGDVQGLDEMDWSDAIQRIEMIVGAVIGTGGLPLMLGGDHSVSYSAIAAIARRHRVNIVWFDAHTDCCAWEGGARHNHKQVLRRCASLPGVGRIVQVGHRGITYHDERQQVPALHVVPAKQARTLQMDALLDLLPATEPVYLSVDIDVLDPQLAPGTGHPVPGGLDVRTVCGLAAAIMRHRPLAGLDLTEVNPLLDINGSTAMAAATVLDAVVRALPQQPGARAAQRREVFETEADA
ncbi:Proclavaminate amidinohydrolase [compost metagenome]